MDACITEFNHLEKEQSLPDNKGSPFILDIFLILKQLKVKEKVSWNMGKQCHNNVFLYFKNDIKFTPNLWHSLLQHWHLMVMRLSSIKAYFHLDNREQTLYNLSLKNKHRNKHKKDPQNDLQLSLAWYFVKENTPRDVILVSLFLEIIFNDHCTFINQSTYIDLVQILISLRTG